MPGMHTAIPCTGSTADQAVSTVHVQLGAAKHLTRPLTHSSCVIISIDIRLSYHVVCNLVRQYAEPIVCNRVIAYLINICRIDETSIYLDPFYST